MSQILWHLQNNQDHFETYCKKTEFWYWRSSWIQDFPVILGVSQYVWKIFLWSLWNIRVYFQTKSNCAARQIFGSLLERVVEIFEKKLPGIALVDAVEFIVQFVILVRGMTASEQQAYVVGCCLWIMHWNPVSLLISSFCRVDLGIFVTFLSISKDLYQGMSVSFGSRIVFTLSL